MEIRGSFIKVYYNYRKKVRTVGTKTGLSNDCIETEFSNQSSSIICPRQTFAI